MLKTIASAVLIATALFSTSVQATQQDVLPIEECVSHAPYGFPKSRKIKSTTICRKGYVLEHDNVAKIPMWVSYVLSPTEVMGCLPRRDAFATDRSLDDAATPGDYAKSGYDMGHMANSADMRWDVQVEEDSFILSNMAPQLPGFNRGIWKKLEDYTRAWSFSREHDLLIYVGPIYNRKQNKTIGRSMVTVPSGFYKIIIDTVTSEAMVYTFPHKGARGSLTPFITSLAEVQRQTNLVFPLPATTSFSVSPWQLKIKSTSQVRKEACKLK